MNFAISYVYVDITKSVFWEGDQPEAGRGPKSDQVIALYAL